MESTSNRLKYRLKELAETLIRTSFLSEREFAKRLNVPWSTYQKDKFTLVSDGFSMPEERLQKYAMGFNIPLSDVLNYTVDQKKVLFKHDSKVSLSKQFGLR